MKTHVLSYYSLSDPVTVSVYGLGACLLQSGKPVSYAYGQIEKEMLAITCGCTKSYDYIYVRQDVTIETDDKPLEALHRKLLSAAPPRIQRMMLKLQKCVFKVV